ncbi:MAG: hypothetical protein HOV80_36545 [Polyangiaceae bacterium]|nr:hypothetical protein [Polyangiaceae bacterium]
MGVARLGCAIAFIGVVSACASRAEDPDRTVSVEPPIASAAPRSPLSGSASAIASASTSPKPPPLPPTPAGIDKERFEVLASLCAVGMFTSPTATYVGCRSTPPFEKPDELPDGTLRDVDDPYKICILSDYYRGSFSAPGKDEAILALDACNEDRVNDITPGNILLAEKVSGVWRITGFQPDTNAHDCKLAKRPDRTMLVCEAGMGAFSDGALDWRYSLDFAEPQGRRIKVFTKLYRSPPTSCMVGAEILGERGIVLVNTTDEKWVDIDKDGDLDITFTLERAAVLPSAALAKKVEAQCAKNKDAAPFVNLEKLAGPRKRFSIQIKAEATSFVPTPESQKVLDAWGAEAPEFWWNIVK